MTEKRKPGRPRKEKLATPEQMQKIESALGQPLDEFIKTFTDDHKRRIFSDNLSKQLKRTQWLTSNSSSNGTYQPIYSEQLLQKVNVNPMAASSEQIEKWLLAPQYFDQNLRHLSQYLSYAVGQYNRSVWYLHSLKAFNYKLLPSDSDIEVNINEDDYLHAYDICLRTLQKMNIRYQIPKADLQVMTDGAAFYWISETDDTISLLPLPCDYCYLTSPFTYGFLFAIDLTFFDQFVSIPNQIPELTKAYNKFVEMRTALYKGEALAPYQYYQVPPSQGWAFTFDPIHADKLPPLASAMSASLDTLSYKEIIKNKIALDLYKVIAMKIPLDKDNKAMSISYTLAEEITQTIQSLLPENIKVFSSPFDSEAINTDQAEKFDQIVNISNDSVYASLGLSQGLFGSSQVKMAAALQLSSNVDFNYVEHMYRQYENFINFQLSLKTKKYKFQVQMFGNKLNEASDIAMYAGLVSTTNSHLLDFYAATGKEPFQVKSTLLLEKFLGLKELMEPIQSMFNSKSDKGGRPSQTTVDESGESTRSYDSNNQRFSLQNCIQCGGNLGSTPVRKVFCSELCKEVFSESLENED